MVKFFIFVLTLFTAAMAASAVVFVAGATVNVLAIANLIAVFLFVMMLVGMYAVAFHLISNVHVGLQVYIVYESDYTADQLFFFLNTTISLAELRCLRVSIMFFSVKSTECARKKTRCSAIAERPQRYSFRQK